MQEIFDRIWLHPNQGPRDPLNDPLNAFLFYEFMRAPNLGPYFEVPPHNFEVSPHNWPTKVSPHKTTRAVGHKCHMWYLLPLGRAPTLPFFLIFLSAISPTILTFSQHTSKKDLAEKKASTECSHTKMGGMIDAHHADLAQRSRARTRKQRLCLIMPTHGAALSKLPSRILSRQPQETSSPRFHLYTMVWKWTNASAIVTEQSRVDTWTASADTNLGIEHRLLAAAVELRLRWPWRTHFRTCHMYEHILQKAVIVGWKQAHTEQHIGANDA